MTRAQRGSVVIAVVSVLLTVVLACPASAQGTLPAGLPVDVTTVVLASRQLDEAPPDRRWVLRRGHPLNEDAHAHAPGFIYAAVGATYLVVEDTQGALMAEGSAAWAPPIGHLHTAPYRTGSTGQANDPAGLEVWTILLERDLDLRQPGASVISPPPLRLPPGPYEARLSVTTFRAGAATGLLQRNGPELAYTLSGAWELEYLGVPFALGAFQGYAADPDAPHRLRNVSASEARVLSAQLIHAAQRAGG